MTLGHRRYHIVHSPGAQQLSSQQSVTYVGLCAIAVDARRIGEIYTYVMEHCGSRKHVEIHVEVLSGSYVNSQCRNLTGVGNIYIPQARARGI